jgi:hypothetical protein
VKDDQCPAGQEEVWMSGGGLYVGTLETWLGESTCKIGGRSMRASAPDDFPKNVSCCMADNWQFYEHRLMTQLCGVYRFSHREVYNF